MRRWLLGNQGDMVEGALTLPLMALVTLALVNLALAGYGSVTANNAVNYAARIASVSQRNVTGEALNAANRALQAGIGDYTVAIQADSHPGGLVQVSVQWEVPNFFGSLMPFFGAPNEPINGEAVSVFRKEGW
jgi:Flp pilus assembly protein TadG